MRRIIATLITLTVITLITLCPAKAEANPEMLTAASLTNPTHGHIYPDAAVITALDYETDTVSVENSVGFTYTFKGCEDYCEGELMALIMFGAGEPTIEDDTIVEARYTGYCVY